MIRQSPIRTSLLLICTGFLSLLLFFTACEHKSDSPVIARVGKATLTLDDLYASMPPEMREQITREQNIQYIRQWMDTEILYQEALRKRIHREKVNRNRLERMKKDLLAAEMISRSTIRAQNNLLDSRHVEEYYEQNKENFPREQDMVRFQEIIVEDLAAAHEIRRTLNGSNFKEVADSRSDDLVHSYIDTLFLPLDELEPAISRAISNTAAPGITTPVRTDVGFHIINLIAKFEKDSISTLEEVRDIITDRLSNEKQKKEAQRMISELRLKTNTEFNFDLIPGTDRPMEHKPE